MTKNPGIKPEFKMAIRPIWNYQRKLEHTDLYWSQLAAVETTPFCLKWCCFDRRPGFVRLVDR